jgi:hypothetical protein
MPVPLRADIAIQSPIVLDRAGIPPDEPRARRDAGVRDDALRVAELEVRAKNFDAPQS